MLNQNDKVMIVKGELNALYGSRIFKCDCDQFTSFGNGREVILLKGLMKLIDVSTLKKI